MFRYLSTGDFRLCLFCVIFIRCGTIVANDVGKLPDELLPELYLKYREAITDDRNTTSARRFLTHNKLYEVHVKKLKEVNGFKVHNLMIKEQVQGNNNPLIYINNPVESKLPKAYLSLEEFKNALTLRVQAQKDELYKNRKGTSKDDTKNMTLHKNSTKEYVVAKMSVKSKIIPTEVKTVTERNATVLRSSTAVTVKENSGVFKTKTTTTNFKVTTPQILATRTSVTTMKNNNLATSDQPEINPTTIDIQSLNAEISETTDSVTKASTKTEITESLSMDDIKATLKRTITKQQFTKNDFSIPNFLTIESANITKNLETTGELKDKNTVLSSVSIKTNTLFNFTQEIDTYNTNYSLTTFHNKPLQENSVKVTENETKKTPKRLKVSRAAKVKEKLTTKSTTRKRSTLGRPLVYMGNF